MNALDKGFKVSRQARQLINHLARSNGFPYQMPGDGGQSSRSHTHVNGMFPQCDILLSGLSLSSIAEAAISVSERLSLWRWTDSDSHHMDI